MAAAAVTPAAVQTPMDMMAAMKAQLEALAAVNAKNTAALEALVAENAKLKASQARQQQTGVYAKIYALGVPRVNAKGEPVIDEDKKSKTYGQQKVGKGNVCIYGLNTMPVSLFAGQVLKMLDLDFRASLLRMMQDNTEKLDWKRPEEQEVLKAMVAALPKA